MVERARRKWTISGQALGSCDVIIRRIAVEAETLILWPPDAKS